MLIKSGSLWLKKLNDQKAQKSTPEESLENLKEKKKPQIHMLCLRNGNKLHP